MRGMQLIGGFGSLLVLTCVVMGYEDGEDDGDAEPESEFRHNYRLTKRFYNTPMDAGFETKCPRGLFMIAFRVKYTDKVGGFFYKCAPHTNFEKLSGEEGYQSQGVKDGKFTEEYGANGLILGFDFQTKVNDKKGLRLTNIKAYTTDPENKDVKTQTGLKDGSYSGVRILCLKRKAVCGMSLQDTVDGKGDITLLEFKCCTIPDTAANCEGKDAWKTFRSCDNRDMAKDGTNLGCTRKVTTGMSMSSAQHSSGLQSGMQAASVGFSAGYEGAVVSATMEASIGVSKATGMSWTKEDTQLFSDSSTITISTEVAPGYRSTLQQAVGTCGPFTLSSNVYRRVDEKKKEDTRTPKRTRRNSKVGPGRSAVGKTTEAIMYMRVEKVNNKTIIRQDVGCFTI